MKAHGDNNKKHIFGLTATSDILLDTALNPKVHKIRQLPLPSLFTQFSLYTEEIEEKEVHS